MPSKSPGSAAACPFSSNLSAFVLNNTLNAIKLPGVLTFLCKFFHPLNSTFKFYQKIRHSLIPILDWHSPFSGNIVNC